ncbi:hypothetical protein [Virgibacillus senegalensis]|nr:hypothetical protein [Virgibacillus senegalensis]
MGQKPLHYDGSGKPPIMPEKSTATQPIQISAEARKNISGNPYIPN